MASQKKLFFLILVVTFLNEVSVGWCGSIEHPFVKIIKNVLNDKVISGRCAEDLGIFLNKLDGVGEDDMWALQMLDATAKVPVGLVSYNFGELGHFTQCTEIEAKRENIKGKYCIGNIVINSSVAELYSAQFQKKNLKHLVSKIEGRVEMVGKPSWAMCLPHNCNNKDTMVLMNKSQLFGFGVNSVTCQTIEDVYPSLTRDAVIGISILSFLTFIVLLSTSYDIFCQNNRKVHPGLIAFSLYTNGKKLFQMPNRSTNLTCLDGIRVLSMFWIIILHTWTVYTSGPVYNSKDLIKMSNSIFSMAFNNGDLACDTFLLVGGILVTYIYFKKHNNQSLGLFFIFRHYSHRIIRLTPPLAAVTLISATLLRYMGSGPNWPDIVNYFEGFCKKYWWSTLLYVQNEVNVDELCVGQSWYLNVDMQLYLFSPLIFWILSKYSKSGITLLILASGLSIFLGFFRAFEDELSGLHPNSFSKTSALVYMHDYYLRTETRAAPWLIGTILGYMLTKKKITDAYLPKKITIPMWILTFAVILLCVFGGFSTLRGPEYNKLQNAFYIAFVKPSFAMTVGWIIWACATNHGGIVNSILSLQIFQFLNKFIYSMYLIHVTSLYVIMYSTKTTVYISFFNLAYWFWGIFMFMFGISTIWILVFEMPVVVLEKVLLPPSDTNEGCMKEKSNKNPIP